MVQETECFPPSQNARPPEGTWGDAFGIKHLSDAEWEEHERKRKALFDQRHVVLCHAMLCRAALCHADVDQCLSCTIIQHDHFGLT